MTISMITEQIHSLWKTKRFHNVFVKLLFARSSVLNIVKNWPLCKPLQINTVTQPTTGPWPVEKKTGSLHNPSFPKQPPILSPSVPKKCFFPTGSWILCQKFKADGWKKTSASKRTAYSTNSSTTTLSCHERKKHNHIRDTVLIFEDKSLVSQLCSFMCLGFVPLTN